MTMTSITKVKMAFAGAGIALYAVGIRLDDARWRYAGIAGIAIAFLMRFVKPREPSNQLPNEK